MFVFLGLIYTFEGSMKKILGCLLILQQTKKRISFALNVVSRSK